MNTLDDPTIPDDLGELLRSASSGLDVQPAALGSVQRRARQRRRRRHACVAGGAGVLVLLGGLAVAQVVTGDGGEQVVTATQPLRAELTGTVPQPLLLWGEPLTDPSADIDLVNGDGTWLDEITPSGPVHWWHSEPGFQGVRGVVLGDGRRFGLAIEGTTDDSARTTLDEVGPDDRTSRTIALSKPSDDPSTSIDLIGVSGSEVILERQTESERTALPGGGSSFTIQSVFTALDVDTGAERPLADGVGSGDAAAAGDRLVTAPGTDCTLAVHRLDGDGPVRTLSGGCAPGVANLTGLASSLAISPDGRYAAAVWMQLRTTGPGENELTIVDLDTGEVVGAQEVSAQSPITRIGWTGERTLTVAAQPGTPSLPATAGPATVVTVPYRGF